MTKLNTRAIDAFFAGLKADGEGAARVTNSGKPERVRRYVTKKATYNRRAIVIEIHPEADSISARLKGTRTRYQADLRDIFLTMAGWFAAAERKRKKDERKARKGVK
jgi:hypothetical protein